MLEITNLEEGGGAKVCPSLQGKKLPPMESEKPPKITHQWRGNGAETCPNPANKNHRPWRGECNHQTALDASPKCLQKTPQAAPRKFVPPLAKKEK